MSKLESTPSAWTAGPCTGTPDTNIVQWPQPGVGGKGCTNKEVLAIICKESIFSAFSLEQLPKELGKSHHLKKTDSSYSEIFLL